MKADAFRRINQGKPNLAHRRLRPRALEDTANPTRRDADGRRRRLLSSGALISFDRQSTLVAEPPETAGPKFGDRAVRFASVLPSQHESKKSKQGGNSAECQAAPSRLNSSSNAAANSRRIGDRNLERHSR